MGGRLTIFAAFMLCAFIAVVELSYTVKEVEIDFNKPFKTFSPKEVANYDGTDVSHL